MNLYLHDHLDNRYERRNKYLLELTTLQSERTKENRREVNSQIRELKRNKKTHRYIVSLKEFKKEHRKYNFKNVFSFLNDFKDTKGSFFVRRNQFQLKRAQNDILFYKKYVDLCYDAELKFEIAKLKTGEIPHLITTIEEIEDKIRETKQSKKKLAAVDTNKLKSDLKEYKEQRKEKLKEEARLVEQRYKDNSISQTAKNKAIAELKRAFKEDINIRRFEFPKRKTNATLRHSNYDLRNSKKKTSNLLKDQIVDIKIKTPTEYMFNTAFVPFVFGLIPGVGQLIYGQKLKALLMTALSVFIYALAVPYALGYGNYQGDGIRGLLTLKGELRYISSMIFLIEGIIAIFLLVIAMFVIVSNIKDLWNIEKCKQKGIRPNKWHETKSKIFVDGYPYVVTLPAFITIIFVVLVPIATTILLSFTDRNDLPNKTRFFWSGLSNFKDLVAGEAGTAAGPFWNVFGWTIVWTLVSTTLAILIGFALALLLNNDRIKGKKFFRSIYLLPWAVPAFVSILFFRIMFGQGDAGVLRAFLGVETIIHNTNLSRIVLILIQGWLGSAYVFILSTGVLQAVPNDLYEAAYIDGASSWRKLTRITLPIVLFQTAPLLIGQYTFNFNNFSIIYLFNGGGPNLIEKYGIYAGSTDILLSYIYKLTMDRYYFAMGAAVTLVISALLIFITFIGFKNSKAFKEERL